MNHKEQMHYTEKYFSIEKIEGTTLDIVMPGSTAVTKLQYTYDGVKWYPMQEFHEFELTYESLLTIKGNLSPGDTIGTIRFYNATFRLFGNAMALVYGDNAMNETSLVNYPYVFDYLFDSNDDLVEVSENLLPATEVGSYSYARMFRKCTSLINAPKLPATIVNEGAYKSMFNTCSSLVNVPEILPPTTLTTDCYGFMFRDCKALTTAPKLPAINLITRCYDYMFYGCSKLNYINAAFITKPTTDFTANWVYGVSNSGKFVKNRNAGWSVTGVNGIPSGWTTVAE